jgi:hypothetical protein
MTGRSSDEFANVAQFCAVERLKSKMEGPRYLPSEALRETVETFSL